MFSFPFSFRDSTYTATCEVIDQSSNTLFKIMVDDTTLQQFFGAWHSFVRDDQGNFTRSLPRVVGGRDFIDALYEGFLSYLVSNPLLESPLPN